MVCLTYEKTLRQVALLIVDGLWVDEEKEELQVIGNGRKETCFAVAGPQPVHSWSTISLKWPQ